MIAADRAWASTHPTRRFWLRPATADEAVAPPGEAAVVVFARVRDGIVAATVRVAGQVPPDDEATASELLVQVVQAQGGWH
jgi:hypothetical protein